MSAAGPFPSKHRSSQSEGNPVNAEPANHPRTMNHTAPDAGVLDGLLAGLDALARAPALKCAIATGAARVRLAAPRTPQHGQPT